MLVCSYIDYESCGDEALLAQATFTVKNTAYEPMLITCHRIEHISNVRLADVKAEKRIGNMKMQVVTGDLEVLTRFLAIATGLHSQIIGEKAIELQADAYVQTLNDDNPLKVILLKTLSFARNIRKEHSLNAPSHGILALRILHQKTHSPLLLLVGTGMVGREVLESYKDLGYPEILLLSRRYKKARKRLSDLIGKENIMSIYQFNRLKNSKQYDMLIATSGASDEYREEIQKLAVHKNCAGVVDVSANVISDKRIDTITLFTPQMKKIVTEHNVHWLKTKEALLKQLPLLVTKHLL